MLEDEEKRKKPRLSKMSIINNDIHRNDNDVGSRHIVSRITSKLVVVFLLFTSDLFNLQSAKFIG